MRETGLGTSLMLIAVGAILAFAVNFHTTGIDINTVGVILMVVGLIGIVFSFLIAESGFFPTVHRHGPTVYYDETPPASDVTPPHSHRQVDTADVVYEDASGVRTERVTRTHRPHSA